MLTPETSFKRIWTETKPQVAQFLLASTLPGKAYRDVYLKRLRPRLKQLYNDLPPSIRRIIH